MATITKNRSKLRQFGSAPYGNLSILNYQIKTNASGALLDSNSTAAIASGDKLDLGPLPEGMSLDEARIIEAATDLEEDAFAADFAKQMEQEGAQ